MGISDEEKEADVEENGETEIVLDLSGRKLVKLEKAPSHRAFATALVLDDNALQSLHNLDSYGELQRISLSNNKIVRMYFFARMYSLRILNLPGNNIVNIEGLKELHHLVHLNLAANSIKSMDGLSHCFKLQHLNLSGNQITTVSDLSPLVNLKELFLHRNKMYNLSRCNKYLPSSLVILTLSDNQICDLNHLFTISHLNNLEQFTILNNPCLQPLQMTDLHGLPVGLPLGFDYRPYVINWCLNLKVLDGYKVTPLETLKGEWLYSQGKGRHFQPGEHGPLVEYLSGICLAGGGWGGAALPEHDMKLVKILELAKQHQQELRNPNAEQMNSSRESSSLHSSPAVQRRNGRPPPHSRRHTAPHKICPIERRTQMKNNLFQAPPSKLPPNKYSVELSSTLYGGELKTPESSNNLMTQSMDPAMLSDLNIASGHSTDDGPHSLSMTQSLGPEQLEEALFNGHHQQGKLTWRSQSGNNINYDMTQSLGPEQLAQQLSQPYDVGAKSRVNGLKDYEGDKGNAPFHRSLSAHQASHHAAEARQREKRTGRSTRRGGGAGRYATCLTSNPQGAAFRSSSVGSSGIDRRPPIGSNRSPPRFSPRYGATHYQNGSTPYSSMNGTSRYGGPRSLETSKERNIGQFQRQVTYTREGRSMSITEAVITLQKYWRGCIVRKRYSKTLRSDSKQLKSHEKIKLLELKLQKAEESLDRERKMRLSQLEAIKTLWKQVGRLQGKGTPSATPATTPLTPLTPIDGKGRAKQDETVKELTDFCQQLQNQVISLQDSLTSVSSVMNAFCQLPASKAVLLNADGTSVEGTKALSALTSSISALTTNITNKNEQGESSTEKTLEITTNGCMEEEKTVVNDSSALDSPTLVGNNPAKNNLPQRPSSLPVSQRRN